ncbi:MAG: F0F1 ATP synthase subunit delta, partial [Clostridia bacterium]|nr:F0F1 ATP synthase subunit delta [Clostridia bacterium]
QEVIAELEQKICSRMGKKVVVQKKLNKSLIGGVRVRVADDVYQRSVSADIENLIRSCKKP